MNPHKRFVIIFLALTFIFPALLCILLYIYDPLQIYHKPYFREVTFSGDMRVQAKGVIKHYNFDSFILGTSMMQNASAEEAKQKLGGKWINISSSGFTLNERAVILDYMLKRTKTKNIIYSLDIWYLVNNHTNDIKNFAFLYDNNALNDLKIYLNQQNILCALKFSSNINCVGERDIEILVNWAREIWHSARFGGINKWLENKDNEQIKDIIKELANMSAPPPYNPKPFTDSIESNQKYLEKNFLAFVRRYPKVQFSIVIPTHSRLYYRLNSEVYPKEKVILNWLINESQNLSNMKIYGFDDLDYADNIANYKDLTHYNVDMNSMQLNAIANGTHILTLQNIDKYLATMESKIKSYDITPLIEQIKAWEVQNKSN